MVTVILALAKGNWDFGASGARLASACAAEKQLRGCQRFLGRPVVVRSAGAGDPRTASPRTPQPGAWVRPVLRPGLELILNSQHSAHPGSQFAVRILDFDPNFDFATDGAHLSADMITLNKK